MEGYERRESQHGRREVDTYRFKALEKRMDNLEAAIDKAAAEQVKTGLAISQLAGSLPYTYISRIEHREQNQWTGQRFVIVAVCTTPLLSLAGIVIALVNHG